MKRAGIIVLALVVLFSFASCEQFFSTNFFSPFIKVTPQTVDEINASTPADVAAEVAVSIDSPSYIAELEANPEIFAAIQSQLEVGFTDLTGTVEVQQESAILYAELQMQTTGGSELVNNVVEQLTVITGLLSGDSTDLQTTVEDLLAAILPTEMIDPATNLPSLETPEAQAVFLEMVEGFIAAQVAYDALGTSLGTPVAGAVPEYGTELANPGALAQNAIVCALVGAIQPPAGYTPPPDTPAGTTPAAAYLLQLLVSPETAPAPTLTVPDLTAGSSLGNILAAAGMSGLIPATTP